MPYKTGHADWSGLDLGLFIGAGVLVTAGLYETPVGVLCRSAAFLLGMNDRADRKVARSEATIGDNKDEQVFAQFGRPAETNEETTSTEEANKCPRDVSDETPTAVGPVKMRDKALSTAEDVRSSSTEIEKTSGDAVDGGDNEEVLEDAVNKRGERDHVLHVPVSPRLQRKLRCAVLYADWQEDSQFCLRDDAMTNQRVRFSWFGQEDEDDIDDVTEVKVYCAVLEGVWREEFGLVENHVTNMTGGDNDMDTYYPGHGRRNDIQSVNENWV
uniref:Uncharacterized protein n=1 Tax=Branchiostoma floridae TaxID=7739 RepID=C3YJS1_BRAFL|eukprot:XP_002603367.1 hypothetical protein BRAFLDRAFT_80360 [Branchiostoma floridae]